MARAGYPGWRGPIMNGDQLWDIVEGLKANGLLEYSHLVTGDVLAMAKGTPHSQPWIQKVDHKLEFKTRYTLLDANMLRYVQCRLHR
jgi:hypothetical protein